MASTDSRSPALNRPEPARQRLTSPWTLLGIALAVAITLILIFPGRGILTRQTVEQVRPDAVSLTYLANLARQDPANSTIRFKLAEERVKLGNIAEARATLETLYNHSDPAVRQRARLEDFKLQMQQMQAMAPESKERAKEMDRLRQELVAMTQYQWDTPGLIELTGLAGQLGAYRLRAEIYLRIVKTDTTVTPEWIDDAAQKAVNDSQYLTAAEIHFTAMERAKTIGERRHHFIGAMKAYQAGNMSREGILAGDTRMGPLANDDETLQFMIKLARAANDVKRAQGYAKRLLRMSEGGVAGRWLRAAADFVVPAALAAEVPPAPKPERPRPTVPKGMRPYNAENYQLAYEIFVANKNFDDAYRVARSAVDQVPNDMRWRERLAQVSEWSGRPSEALEHWLAIARRTGQGNAWQAVMRIAPGLFEDEALLEAMRYQAGTTTSLTDDQWRAIIDAYERVGRPREAIEMLEQEMKRRPRPVLLESLAYLKERTGDIDGAIVAYQRVIAESGPTTERVTTLATLMISRGRFKEAYALLDGYRTRAPADDVEYLRLLADLADRLRDDAAAQVAYERIVAHPKAESGDFSRLYQILEKRQPEAAARLAEAAYARFKDPSFLIAALGMHSQRRDFIAMQRILTALSPAEERQLEKNPSFLMLRGEYRGATGRIKLGIEDFREALRIEPTNRYARMGLIFLLIDARELDQLRRELPAAVKLAQTDPEFLGPVGSAFLALSDPERGLAYYAAATKRHPDDYLWLLNYADALDQNNRNDMAFRVRRHAFIKIQEEAAKYPQDKIPLKVVQAQARVALQYMPVDQASAVLRNLLRADAEASTTPSLFEAARGIDASTRELVLAWAIQTDNYVAAKAWLWKQYGRSLAIAAPTWAEARIAVEFKDLDTLQKALEAQSGDAIPRYDRHQAARMTQQYRLAQSIAFTELEKQPYDDEMHLRVTQSVLDMVNHTQVGYTNIRRGTVKGHEYLAEMAVWSGPRLRISADVSYIDQRLLNTSALATIPGSDRQYGLTALWRHNIGESTFSVFHREALGEAVGFRVTHARPLGPRVSTRVGISYNDRADDTTSLAVGGLRDRAYVDLSYQLAKREYLFGELYGTRYYTQGGDRTYIGNSYGLIWEAGHRFRTEYPDWHIRAAGSINHYSHNGSGDANTSILTLDGSVPTASFFLPPSSSTYGIYTGFGQFYRTQYTRAVRPFVDFGINRNTVTGNGYAALGGLSGSVFGADRLTAFISIGRGGRGVDELTREVGLRYMYLFDHF